MFYKNSAHMRIKVVLFRITCTNLVNFIRKIVKLNEHVIGKIIGPTSQSIKTIESKDANFKTL